MAKEENKQFKVVPYEGGQPYKFVHSNEPPFCKPEEIKSKMRVVIRAFTKDGYYRDIVLMDSNQVIMCDKRIKEDPSFSIMTDLIGVGVGIIPKDFPEIVCFEVVIRDKNG